ncbi:MAG: 2-amino-4-hydroxy-6-hydroxymethyldihydropteridine diphosphokinase, partial [Deltaproteobacteria bacterium]|nr:2-amino-4-hydroxy-6-hydroxymethyldihydropteridine diphosphokinase [Deltaproteobacteria bacterium]
INTGLSAQEIIQMLFGVEKRMGRVRKGIKWESRIIDLDLLLVGNEIINDKNLIVPHPRMHMRRFVMAPMVDIAPDLIHPVLKRSMREILNEIPATDQEIKLMVKN